MKLGIVNNETWIFFRNIVEYLANQYSVTVFKPINWPLPIMKQKASHYLLRQSLNKFINQNDVVLFEWASAMLMESSKLKTSVSAAFITRLHRYEMFTWVNQINWDAVNYIILDTEAMRKKLLAKTNILPERAFVIPPIGIPLDKINDSPKTFRGNIGILATLHPRKRIYELILAFHSLLKDHPEYHLHIGGNSVPEHQDYYESLIYLTQKLGIENKITFYNKVEDRWNWYDNMDIFVSNSYSEGMQVAPLEAATRGCYCVTHWWEGAEEIFDHDELFLKEIDFVEKIEKYSRASAEEQIRMKEPLKNFVREKCSINIITSQIQSIIERAADERLKAG